MRRLSLALPSTLIVGMLCVVSAADLSPATGIDYQKLSGTWYEVASVPNARQRDLVNVTHTFSLDKDNDMTLISSGTKKKRGRVMTMKGKGQLPAIGAPAAFSLKYYGLISFDYSILECDKDYRHAVVSAEKGKYLWVLSRSPKIDEESYNATIAALSKRGFAVEELERSSQDNSAVASH